MIATWTMRGGLKANATNHGQPRQWTVTAWASLPDGTKEKLVYLPRGKCSLRTIVEDINRRLAEFEHEHGVETVDAGFQAVAR